MVWTKIQNGVLYLTWSNIDCTEYTSHCGDYVFVSNAIYRASANNRVSSVRVSQNIIIILYYWTELDISPISFYKQNQPLKSSNFFIPNR